MQEQFKRRIWQIGSNWECSRAELRTMGGMPGCFCLPKIHVPAINLALLGDASFLTDHKLKYPYMAGAMAGGISSAAMVIKLAEAGLLGSFGAGGLEPSQVEQAIVTCQRAVVDKAYAINLIYTPFDPTWEERMTQLLITYGVNLIEASAYIKITPGLVRYRLHGIHRDQQGRVIAPNRIIAKVSRLEVAQQFFAPPDAKMVAELAAAGVISAQQAALAQEIPLAQDVTVEADSGGHTDNRPAFTLFSAVQALQDRMMERYDYEQPLRLGLAGGIGTPQAVSAAFALGAAYVVTGSINQGCLEAGCSDHVKKMLALAGQADMAMAPSAHMFELGAKVQVLKKGTMFAMRAAKLYELYNKHKSVQEIGPEEREQLEKMVFRQTLDEVWASTSEFFAHKDPQQLVKARASERHRMALIFRSYLGCSSRWAIAGDESRQMDYQIWCGPAMGAFNEWTRGSDLELPGGRDVVTVALNLLVGAAVMMRLAALKRQGVVIGSEGAFVRPWSVAQLAQMIGDDKIE